MKQPATYRFRLYTAGQSQNSVQALKNLRELCRAHLVDRHEIEVVDVLRDPEQALADGILVTPTLIRVAPVPTCKIFGNLSQTDIVRATLGLSPEST